MRMFRLMSLVLVGVGGLHLSACEGRDVRLNSLPPGAVNAQAGEAIADVPGGPGRIFGPGPAGWWDSERASCPKVMLEDGKWRMWYYGRDASFDRGIFLPTGRVGLAESDDGVSWRRVRGPLTMGAVFEPHPDPARFDSGHLGISDIQKIDGFYWMWYFAGDTSRNSRGKGFPMRPGAAISGDGIHWTRLEGEVRGALLDAGDEGDFDELMVAWPQVIRVDEHDWRMYYHTVDRDGFYLVALARSEDGLNWRKSGVVMGPGPAGRFDDLGVATRHILRLHGQWVMFYEGVKDIGEGRNVGRQIGVAVSDDGLAWQRIDGQDTGGAIIAEVPLGSGLWDHRLGCPWVVPQDDGSLYLYYIGSNEIPAGRPVNELSAVHQIGLAISDGDITRWRRWAPGHAAP